LTVGIGEGFLLSNEVKGCQAGPVENLRQAVSSLLANLK
jgi:hypothetical protein